MYFFVNFNLKGNKMDNLFKVLGDQTRIEILKLLNKEDLKMCEIAINFQMSKASISKHLYILKQANLVNSKKDGQFKIYSINNNCKERILREITNIFN